MVDDERDMRAIVRGVLDGSGYGVLEASTGRRMMEIIKGARVDLVLLDLMLSDGNALDLIPAIRAQTQAPVLVLSGHGTDRDRVAALDGGADDYIAKPFGSRELCARVRANLRRIRQGAISGHSGEKIKFGRWILDRETLRVLEHEVPLSSSLTVREFRVLEALVLSVGRVLSREDLAQAARPGNGEPVFSAGGRAVDIHIARIRAKLGMEGDAANVIKAVRGAGYRLDCETEVVQ